MLTTFKRCEIYPRKTELKSHIFYDTITESYIFSKHKVSPKDKYGYNVVIHILNKNKIIASSDDRTSIAQVSNEFLEKFAKGAKPKYCSVKFIDNNLFINEINQIDIYLLEDSISIQELIDIAAVYEDDYEFGRHIRNEIINT